MVIAPIPLSQHSPRSALDDFGIGVFGQATFTVNDAFDLAAGLRFDYEDKSALVESFFDPPIAPPSRVDAEKSFSNVSPQVSIGYRVRPDKTLYATVGRGYKAGGFNPASAISCLRTFPVSGCAIADCTPTRTRPSA